MGKVNLIILALVGYGWLALWAYQAHTKTDVLNPFIANLF